MQKIILMGLSTLMLAVTISITGAAAADQTNTSPWEKYSFSLGYFFSTLDTSIRLGGGIGVDIDAEDSLDLDTTLAALRLEGSRRFGKHRFDLSWFALKREASRTLGRDIIIEDENGEEITLIEGTVVDSYLDLDLYKLSYSYSLIQDNRLDLALAFGIYVAPISVGISAQGFINDKNEQSFTAPLPLFGLRFDVALTPTWFLRYLGQIFYLEYDSFKGSIYSSTLAVEYKPWQHVALGLGADVFRMKLEARGKDYAEMDLRGNIGFQYSGLMLYAKFLF